MSDARFAPLPPPKRTATFAWRGHVYDVNLDTRALNCPNCGMRMFLPHSVVADTTGLATISPSVVCPTEHGGCGWHVVIQEGNAV